MGSTDTLNKTHQTRAATFLYLEKSIFIFLSFGISYTKQRRATNVWKLSRFSTKNVRVLEKLKKKFSFIQF